MLRILIVDDSTSARYQVAQHLAEYGSCEQARDGLEAVALVESSLTEEEPFDLIVMDVEMPRLNGIEAVRRINDLFESHAVPEEKRSRIIMLSSHGDAGRVLKAQYDAGADLYVTKPFKPETLIQAMASLDLVNSPLDEIE